MLLEVSSLGGQAVRIAAAHDSLLRTVMED